MRVGSLLPWYPIGSTIFSFGPLHACGTKQLSARHPLLSSLAASPESHAELATLARCCACASLVLSSLSSQRARLSVTRLATTATTMIDTDTAVVVVNPTAGVELIVDRRPTPMNPAAALAEGPLNGPKTRTRTRPRSRTTGDMHGGAVGAGLRALRANNAPPSTSADDVLPPDKLSKRLSTRRWSAPTVRSSANDASTAAHSRAPSGPRRRASQIFASLSLAPKANLPALLSRRRSSATRWGLQKQLHRKLTTTITFSVRTLMHCPTRAGVAWS